jgi:hypothetical protein
MLPRHGGALLLLALLGACGLVPARAQVAAWHDSATVLESLSPGSARVATGVQLLQAFADGVGAIAVTSEPPPCACSLAPFLPLALGMPALRLPIDACEAAGVPQRSLGGTACPKDVGTLWRQRQLLPLR